MITGGTGAIVNEWVIDADDPLDPEDLADRLLRVSTVLARSHPSLAPTPEGHPR
ncbi:hypothetical protein [Streptomyces sp. SA15]|uniref:hypothetical protein n=1 Tax=Streptomyces sp. SA15 TaxID=934019 RepID=UPI001C531F0B|nr:hypothetical protein [Streptomyces sp. SA15]